MRSVFTWIQRIGLAVAPVSVFPRLAQKNEKLQWWKLQGQVAQQTRAHEMGLGLVTSLLSHGCYMLMTVVRMSSSGCLSSHTTCGNYYACSEKAVRAFKSVLPFRLFQIPWKWLSTALTRTATPSPAASIFTQILISNHKSCPRACPHQHAPATIGLR